MAFQFYEQYRDEGRGESAGNVIAIDLDATSFVQEGGVCFPAVGPPHGSTPNGPVIPGFFNAEYLGTHCRPVSAARAREVHPRLFEFLDTLS